MSGFDLPPVIGFDHQYKQRSPVRELGEQDPVQKALRLGGQQNPGQQSQGGDVGEADTSFDGLLSSSISEVRSLQRDVDAKYKGLVLGEDVELHDVILAANKSEVMFNLMLEVRNKLVDAWEKLSRSSV